MNHIEYFKEQFDLLQLAGAHQGMAAIRQEAFHEFNRMGIPTMRHEEWKYTRISGLFNKSFRLPVGDTEPGISAADIDKMRLPGHETANELVFVNGRFVSELSAIRSANLQVIPLELAAGNEFKELVATHFNHAHQYLKDGINALSTAFVQDGIFINVPKGQVIADPVYFYHIADTRNAPVFAQPRGLMYIGEQAEIILAETYQTLGAGDSFTNEVMEVVVAENAQVSYYKIQHDETHAHQVSTTHFRQIGKSCVQAVTVSLNGGMVRNNLNVVLEAAHSEAHLYGLYFQRGSSHVDNHTVVDNVAPGCQSNELYKGVLDGDSTGVFNGKVFVRQQAQKTNAFQSNKNVLLSDSATINAKPQLEIFADDVKCSHGCTVGQLDAEGLFYLQSRGIPEKAAMGLLLQGFVVDVVEKIGYEPIRVYVQQLIADRLVNNIE